MQPSKTTLKLVAFALHFSCLIFIGLIFFMASSKGEWTYQFNILKQPQIVMIFCFLAIVESVLVILFPMIAKNSQSSNSGKLWFNFDKLHMHDYNLTIIRMALAESICILGFVVALLNHDALWILPFYGVSQILQVLVGPFNKMGHKVKAYYE